MSKAATRKNSSERARRRLREDEDLAQHRTEVLFDLEQPCADCQHELGFHQFVTFKLPQPCGRAGCGCQNFRPPEESPMLSPSSHDPFAGMEEPPPPDVLPESPQAEAEPRAAAVPPDDGAPELEAGELEAVDAIATRVGAALEAARRPSYSVLVPFPVLTTDAPGIDLAALEEPARRVAEIVEAIQPVLIPPPLVRDLEALVAKANALEVTDAASYKAGCDLYELLAQNEKGIEQTIGPVVGFFHRPWKAMCEFRARFAPPVVAAKRRLSDVCGAWKQAETAKAEAERKRREEAAAAEERQRLADLAAAAKAKGDLQTAAVVTQMAAEVTAPALPLVTAVPATKTKGREGREVEIVDEDRFYKALADGTIPHVAAPIDLAYLKRQATDLPIEEFAKRYPGAIAKKKAGLTASGK